MLAAFPLTTARDERWWNHCRSLESPDISTSFFPRPLKKGVVDLPYIYTSGFDCDRFKVVIVEVITFSAFSNLSLCCFSAYLSGAAFTVALSKSVYDCCIPYQALTSAPDSQSQSIRPPPVPCQAGSEVEGRLICGLMIFWEWSWWLNVWGSSLCFSWKRAHAALVHQQFYCSGISCFQNFWHWFRGKLQYRTHQGWASFQC